MESWELPACRARTIADNAPLKQLAEIRQSIMHQIEKDAERGFDTTIIDMKEYPQLKCLENWCCLYNWLQNLGYQIIDGPFDEKFFILW